MKATFDWFAQVLTISRLHLKPAAIAQMNGSSKNTPRIAYVS